MDANVGVALRRRGMFFIRGMFGTEPRGVHVTLPNP